MNRPSGSPQEDPNATGYDAMTANERRQVAAARPPDMSVDEYNRLVSQSTARGAQSVIAVASSSTQLRTSWQEQNGGNPDRARSEGDNPDGRVYPITFAAQIGEPQNSQNSNLTWLERIMVSGLSAIGLSDDARSMARSATQAVKEFIENPREGIASAGRWIYNNGRAVLRGIGNYLMDRVSPGVSETIVNRTGEMWDWMKNAPSNLLDRARNYLGLNPTEAAPPVATKPDDTRMQDPMPAAVPMSSLNTLDTVAQTSGPALRDGVTATLEGGYRGGNAPAYRSAMTMAALEPEPGPTPLRQTGPQSPRQRVVALVKAEINPEPRLELA